MSVADVARRARRRLPKIIWDFLEGGAEDELTLIRNRSAFGRVELRPRILVDVSSRSTTTTLFGKELKLPVLLAPTGLACLSHPEGEIAAAKAAKASGTLLVVSSASSISIEDVAAASDSPLWFQLYPWRDRKVTGTLIERAQNAGYAALCVTVDVPAVGGRERDVRNGFTVPPRVTLGNAVDLLRHPAWLMGMARGPRITLANLLDLGGPKDVVSLARFVDEQLLNPANDWDELKWMREQWNGPLLIKGILTGGDARRALDHGVDGVIVSNHGGRQLDGVSAALVSLIEVKAAIGDEIPVIVDGGIRRGSDVVKAMALGAQACMIGRPFWYGLACGGQAGVEHVLEIFRQEIDRTLALLGCPQLSQLGKEFVHVRREL